MHPGPNIWMYTYSTCVLGVSKSWGERPEEVYFISASTPHNMSITHVFGNFVTLMEQFKAVAIAIFMCGLRGCSSLSEDPRDNPRMMDSEVSLLLHCAAWKGLLESQVQVELSER